MALLKRYTIDELKEDVHTSNDYEMDYPKISDLFKISKEHFVPKQNVLNLTNTNSKTNDFSLEDVFK